MMIRIVFIFTLGIAVGCNYPQEKILNPNYALKGYDATRGGIQIFSLNYDEITNAQNFGIADEWVTLVTDSPRTLAGWTLEACTASKQFSLAGQINDTVRIYTHTVVGSDKKGFSLDLPDSVWIWNNHGPCTAILHSLGVAVDSIGY